MAGIMAAITIIGCSMGAAAVTDAEMDQAQAIAGKFYVRYINDGAGYLDNWTPTSMSELEKKLTNNTDRENLKKFRAAAHATDYSSWDRDQLAAYWSEQFFKENAGNLDSKAAANGLCRKQIKQAVGRMAVAAPVAATPMAEETTGTSEASKPTEEETAVAAELAQVDGEIQEAHDLVEREASEPVKKENSGTWVYVMVLAILVGVVIFLVAYASKTMKGEPRRKQQKEEAPEEEEETPEEPSRESLPMPEPVIIAEPRRSTVANDSRMREKYAEALAAKAEEIRQLNRQLADMEAMTSKLKDENRRLNSEVERLKRQAAETESAPVAVVTGHHERNARHPRQESRQETKEIYLGRVNSKGIFVRADRHAVDGQSIYKLTTQNGQRGTYTLIHNPLIEEQVLENPGKWLAGGCFAKDIFDTEGRDGICTETPGTAIFQDGAWRVERKAKIRYC